MRMFLPFCFAAAIALGAGCGRDDDAPVLRQVRPAEVTPGAMLMLSGERLDRVATIAVGGRLASDLTVVNAGLVTAITPASLAPGPQPLELRATDGRTVHGAITVVAPPAPPQVAPQAPITPAVPTAAPSPSASTPASPRPPATPATRGEDGDDDDEDKDKDDKQDKKPDERPPPSRGRGR